MSNHITYYKEIDSLVDLSIVSEPTQLSLWESQNMVENSLDLTNKNNQKYEPLKAKAHTPPYKIHKYFARRPWNVFAQIISKFSDVNEVVLDPFCGGGVTIYEGLKLGRKVIGFDLNPLSVFVVESMILKGDDVKSLFVIFKELIDYTINLYDNYYFEYEGEQIQIQWTETTFIVECPACQEQTSLSNANKIRNGIYQCENKNCASHQSKSTGFAQKDATRKGIKYLSLIGHNANKKRVSKDVGEIDIERLDEHLTFLENLCKKNNIVPAQDTIPLNWDRQYEDQLQQKGIIHFQDLFTRRNLLINTLLLNKIKSYEKELSDNDYQLLRIAFSNTVKDTNIMSFTNAGWQSGKPTTWSKHAYWIPSQFCEVNILSAFIKSLKRVKNSISHNRKFNYEINRAKSFQDLANGANILLQNCAIFEDNIPDNSVDAIITDPPYGSNVQYLELSHFWHVWNKDMYKKPPNFALEAVANRKKGFEGAKSMYDYEDNLYSVFEAAHRVLKPEKNMVLTFNNKDISAWLALLFSIFKAGFTLEKDSIYFQDGVENYKQTAHTKYDGSPYGDFIYIFKKSNSKPLKTYDNENDFTNDLHSVFLKYFNTNNDLDKYSLLMNMFNEAIPLIEGFAKSYLITQSHNLYAKFNKSYLNKIY